MKKGNRAPVLSRLRWQVFTAYGILLTIFIAAMSLMPLAKLRPILLENEVKKLRIVAKQLADFCGDLYMSPSEQKLRTRLISTMNEFPDISYILYVDRERKIHWRAQRDSLDFLKQRLAAMDLSPDTASEISTPRDTYVDITETTETQPPLPVHVGFAKSVLKAQMSSLIWNQAAISLVLLAGGLVGVFLFATWLTRPVVQLAAVAEKMSLGDVNVRLNLKSKGEIGRVYLSLERLRESILYAIRQLDNTNGSAEQKSEQHKRKEDRVAQGDKRWSNLR